MSDINKEVQEKLSQIEKGFNDKVESLSKSIDEKLALDVSKAELGEEFKKELKGEVAELAEKHNEVQKALDDFQINAKKQFESSRSKTLGSELKKELDSNESFARFKNGEATMATLEFKAALTTAANASGDVVPADKIAGYKYDPTRMVRVRDFIPTISINGNRLQYIQETSYTNNASTRAEASAYAESAFKLDAVDANARSIGTTIDLTKEMLEDVPALTGYISTRLPAKVQNVEDTQLLFGSGTAPDLQGIMASGGGTAFVTASTGAFYGFFGASASAYTNEFDVLIAAKNQAQLLEYSPNVILVNPTDYHKMYARKDANANYVVFTNGVLTVLGIPIFPNTAVTSGKFVVGDFRMGATIGQRDSLEVSFSYENADNFDKDRVTVKGTERIALAIHNPNAFVWGTFSTAITAINL